MGGGLDTASDTTGREAIYTKFGDFEIMFHTSTLLPFDKGNPQQLHRKRHIGNDVIVIVFHDADPFTPVGIESHFNHVFVVVQPYAPSEPANASESTDEGTSSPLLGPRSSQKPKSTRQSPLRVCQTNAQHKVYRIAFTFKDTIKERARPFLQEPCLLTDDEESRENFLTKLINCERVAMRSEQFEKRLLNVRSQLFTHLNGEILAKESEGKKRGTLWF